jgi:hypothetical protein
MYLKGRIAAPKILKWIIACDYDSNSNKNLMLLLLKYFHNDVIFYGFASFEIDQTFQMYAFSETCFLFLNDNRSKNPCLIIR